MKSQSILGLDVGGTKIGVVIGKATGEISVPGDHLPPILSAGSSRSLTRWSMGGGKC